MIKVRTDRFKANFGKLALSANQTLEIEGSVIIDVTFLGEDEMRQLNAETRNIDKVTDVLSYPYIENPCSPFSKSKYPFEYNARSKAVELGCIAVCTSYIERAAKEDQTVYVKDVYRAFTHGILHLMGYDHMTESEYDVMHAMENQIMIKAGLKI